MPIEIRRAKRKLLKAFLINNSTSSLKSHEKGAESSPPAFYEIYGSRRLGPHRHSLPAFSSTRDVAASCRAAGRPSGPRRLWGRQAATARWRRPHRAAQARRTPLGRPAAGPAQSSSVAAWRPAPAWRRQRLGWRLVSRWSGSVGGPGRSGRQGLLRRREAAAGAFLAAACRAIMVSTRRLGPRPTA